MAAHVVFMVLALQVVSGSEQYRNEGFMDHLHSGIKMAQNLLGSESVALKVADFVVKAFNTVNTPRGPAVHTGPVGPSGPSSHTGSGAGNQRRPTQGGPGDLPDGENASNHYSAEQRPAEASPWRYLVRLLGLQPSQLSAVAVNALVFVAQMLTSFLAGPRRPGKPYRSDDPADWILNKNSKKLQDIIATAKNESLTDLVEELVTDYGSPEETSCIRLLVCKITPYVSRMQEAVFRKRDGSTFNKDVRGAAILYRHLPSQQEIKDRSDVCEKRFADCELNE